LTAAAEVVDFHVAHFGFGVALRDEPRGNRRRHVSDGAGVKTVERQAVDLLLFGR
jgi:hypothetical protein